MGGVCVRPVAIRSALFWVMVSFCMRVSAGSGCHAGWAYVSMGLVYYFYTRAIYSFEGLNVMLMIVRRTLRRV